ncbi:MAG: hypothetical protein KKD73_01675 [Proteobacteria bacterium]|nr:hypothetical protein [Pseudomonadota bacterium]MBU1640080.1 hypothetical protein [Pseudomonadota bacterium]
MPVNPLEVDILALADFGHEVLVTPATGDPYTLTMIYDEPDEEGGLGHINGNLSQPIFSCLPADAVLISPGTVLTLAGIDYKVFDALPRFQAMTEIRVVEQ